MKKVSITLTIFISLFVFLLGCTPSPVSNYFLKSNEPARLDNIVKITFSRPGAFWGGGAQVFVIDRYHPMPTNSLVGFIADYDTPELKPFKTYYPDFHYLDPSVKHKYKTIDNFDFSLWGITDQGSSSKDIKGYVFINNPGNCMDPPTMSARRLGFDAGTVIYTDTSIGKIYHRVYETDDDGNVTSYIPYKYLQKLMDGANMKVVPIEVITCEQDEPSNPFRRQDGILKLDIRQLKIIGTVAAKQTIEWYRPPGQSQLGIIVSAAKQMWIMYDEPKEFKAGYQYNIDLSLAPPATFITRQTPIDQ